MFRNYSSTSSSLRVEEVQTEPGGPAILVYYGALADRKFQHSCCFVCCHSRLVCGSIFESLSQRYCHELVTFILPVCGNPQAPEADTSNMDINQDDDKQLACHRHASLPDKQ
eukprot:1193237-Amphidinium_carterae.1